MYNSFKKVIALKRATDSNRLVSEGGDEFHEFRSAMIDSSEKKNKKLMTEHNISIEAYRQKFNEFQRQGRTTILVGVGNEVRGIIGISDRIKDQGPYALN